MGVETAETGPLGLIYLQSEPLTIAQDLRRGKGGCHQRNGLPQSAVRGARQQVVDDLLFDLELLLIVAVLKVTAATDAVFRAGRRYAVRRWLDDLGDVACGHPLLLLQYSGHDKLLRQNVLEQDNATILMAGQAVSAIDYFFNPEQGVIHFFNDVEGIMNYELRIGNNENLR